MASAVAVAVERCGVARLHPRVRWVSEVLMGDDIPYPSFVQVLDKALVTQKRNPGALILLGEHCKASWSERNEFLFNQKILAPSPWKVLGTERNEFLFNQKILAPSPWKVLGMVRANIQAGWKKLRGQTEEDARPHDQLMLDEALLLLQTRVYLLAQDITGHAGSRDDSEEVHYSSESSSVYTTASTDTDVSDHCSSSSEDC
ncbi:hypothetical protein R1sor_006286 [Riccia sorocarpa]|uniref:Uncharacterized protein n=1 Tax=Riccia sorocarpa TaxID=122646 RepID=A0ABD3HQU0_9MARC